MDSDELVNKNIRLVRYVYNSLTPSLVVRAYKDDLISNGNLGLVMASRTYDESMEYAFSTYACKCIKNYMLRFFKKYKRSMSQEFSLDAQINNDKDGISYMDNIADPKNYEDEIVSDLEYDAFVKKLSPCEQAILIKRKQGLTLKEIGKQYGCTRANISRIVLRIKDKFNIIKTT